MITHPQQPPSTSARRAPRIAQPRPEAWSAALAPSQRRAADRRSQLARRRSAQQWLRNLAAR